MAGVIRSGVIRKYNKSARHEKLQNEKEGVFFIDS